jgi:hypothetical protein
LGAKDPCICSRLYGTSSAISITSIRLENTS